MMEEAGEVDLYGHEGLPCIKSREGSGRCLAQKVPPSRWPLPFQPTIPSIARLYPSWLLPRLLSRRTAAAKTLDISAWAQSETSSESVLVLVGKNPSQRLHRDGAKVYFGHYPHSQSFPFPEVTAPQSLLCILVAFHVLLVGLLRKHIVLCFYFYENYTILYISCSFFN